MKRRGSLNPYESWSRIICDIIALNVNLLMMYFRTEFKWVHIIKFSTLSFGDVGKLLHINVFLNLINYTAKYDWIKVLAREASWQPSSNMPQSVIVTSVTNRGK